MRYYMNKKKVRNWFITIVILFGICDIYLRIFGTLGDSRGPDLAGSMDDILGMPGVDGTKNEEIAQLMDTLDISADEWNKPTCSPYGYPEYREKYEVDGKFRLKKCVQIFGDINWPEKYCNHWTKKHCIWLDAYDYILQRPDILDQVIKTMERPCKYWLPQKYKDYLAKKGESLEYGQISRSLQCDIDVKKRRLETVVLTIFDSERQPRFDIVVQRKE